MSNLTNSINLYSFLIEKQRLSNPKILRQILLIDNDFCTHFRKDKHAKQYKDEADRVSQEIFLKYNNLKNKRERLTKMIEEILKCKIKREDGEEIGFVTTSSYTGDYTYNILDVGKFFVVNISFID